MEEASEAAVRHITHLSVSKVKETNCAKKLGPEPARGCTFATVFPCQSSTQ